MSLKYKKIYIDTRYKTSDSKSTSDFKIYQLVFLDILIKY